MAMGAAAPVAPTSAAQPDAGEPMTFVPDRGFGARPSGSHPAAASGAHPAATSGAHPAAPAWEPPPPAPAPRAAPLLIDVTSQSLGIETVGGLMDVVIHRNATIPARVSRAFITSRDNQTEVVINIFEGESPRVDENRALGQLSLVGLPPGLRGDVKIDVSFEINTDGMLQVTARDRTSGRIQQTRLHIAGGGGGARPGGSANVPSSGL